MPTPPRSGAHGRRRADPAGSADSGKHAEASRVRLLGAGTARSRVLSAGAAALARAADLDTALAVIVEAGAAAVGAPMAAVFGQERTAGAWSCC